MKDIICTMLLAVWCFLGSYAIKSSNEMLIKTAQEFDRSEVLVKEMKVSKGHMVVELNGERKTILLSPVHPQVGMFAEMEKDIAFSKPVKAKIDYYYGYDSSSYTVGSNLKFTRITTE